MRSLDSKSEQLYDVRMWSRICSLDAKSDELIYMKSHLSLGQSVRSLARSPKQIVKVITMFYEVACPNLKCVKDLCLISTKRS